MCDLPDVSQNVFVDNLQVTDCLPREGVTVCGRLRALLVEATSAEPCICASPGRLEVTATILDELLNHLATQSRTDLTCLCEINQLESPALEVCQQSVDATGAGNGWCYIDPANGIGNTALVESCPESSQRSIRFVGAATPAAGSVVLIALY